MRLLEGVNVQFHREFSRMTGFRRNIAFSQRSRGVCDIQRGVYSMYVTATCARENIVGDTNVPLLQIVPIRGDHGDYVCERYETPIYAPVQRNNISDIKIDITDDTGRRIPFQSGKTIVTLHLRKQGLHNPVMNYQQYYTNQVGGGQSIYTGRRYQRGHGLGYLLGSLFRTVAPMLRKTAVSLGKDVLRSAVSAG